MSLSCKPTVNKITNSAVISINLRMPKEFTLRLFSFAKENVIFFLVSSLHSLKVGLLCHSYRSFSFLCLRNVPYFFSMPVIFLRPGQTLAALNATACDIVRRNMLHTFGHHVAICCNMFDDVVSNLKTARFFVQYCGCWCCARLGPVVACQGPGAHKHTHVATSGNDVYNITHVYCRKIHARVVCSWCTGITAVYFPKV